MVMSSVWLPSFLAKLLIVFLSRNSSRDDFFVELKQLHETVVFCIIYVKSLQIKLSDAKNEVLSFCLCRRCCNGLWSGCTDGVSQVSFEGTEFSAVVAA